MKRKIASRKLKRTCSQCNCGFEKGDVYYVDRRVLPTYDEIISLEYTYCAKCKYRNNAHKSRFKRFIESESCKHPVREEVWSTIPGESHLLQPDHMECTVCGEWL